VWELEVWKRAEEAKFKTHLKQMELETIENITKEWKAKEAKRDGILTAKVSALENMEKKLRLKMQEVQKRESKIVQLEEELRHKIHEVSRQLATKEEEIINIKRRFKEEKLSLQSELKGFKKKVQDAKDLLDETEVRYRAYRKDMEESPVTVMRTEINKKNIEISELKSRFEKSNQEVVSTNNKFKKLRQEHTKLRRDLERQKDEEKQKQGEELERLKIEIKNQQLSDQDRQQVLMLKEEMTRLQTKVLIQEDQITQNNQKMYITNPSNTEMTNTDHSQFAKNTNPFATQGAPGMTKSSKNNGNTSKQQLPKSKQEELQDLRKHLLEDCTYNEDDEFIINLDEQIRRERSVARSPNRDARN
jgi:hypothetical protein